MTPKKSLGQLFKEFEKDPIFISEGIAVDIAESVFKIMEMKKINFAELAERMDVSRPYISKIFNGKPNMTIETLAKIANALDVSLKAPEFIINEPKDIHNSLYDVQYSRGDSIVLEEEENDEQHLAKAA